MKTGRLKLILLIILLFILQSPVFAALGNQLKQDVTIDKFTIVGFTSKAINSETEYNQYKHPQSYENLLSTLESLGNYIPSKKDVDIFSNKDDLVYISILTNTPITVSLSVVDINGTKGLFNDKGNNIPVFIYNQDFGNDDKKTNLTVDTVKSANSYQIFSYPILFYALKTDVDKAPSGRYVGTIKLTIKTV